MNRRGVGRLRGISGRSVWAREQVKNCQFLFTPCGVEWAFVVARPSTTYRQPLDSNGTMVEAEDCPHENERETRCNESKSVLRGTCSWRYRYYPRHLFPDFDRPPEDWLRGYYRWHYPADRGCRWHVYRAFADTLITSAAIRYKGQAG